MIILLALFIFVSCELFESVITHPNVSVVGEIVRIDDAQLRFVVMGDWGGMERQGRDMDFPFTTVGQLMTGIGAIVGQSEEYFFNGCVATSMSRTCRTELRLRCKLVDLPKQ
jgi:hypothetical protein